MSAFDPFRWIMEILFLGFPLLIIGLAVICFLIFVLKPTEWGYWGTRQKESGRLPEDYAQRSPRVSALNEENQRVQRERPAPSEAPKSKDPFPRKSPIGMPGWLFGLVGIVVALLAFAAGVAIRLFVFPAAAAGAGPALQFGFECALSMTVATLLVLAVVNALLLRMGS
jgi:hypothetical protein